jgi:hypothetical protein
MPKIIAIEATGILPAIGRTAARVMNPPPVTPAVPFEVSSNNINTISRLTSKSI